MDWLGAAAEIGSSAVNGAFGLWAQKKQQKYTRENMKSAYEYNEQSAENADVRKRKFYTDFESPEAQMRQLKEAGLSPGMFYGGNGTTGASGGAQGGGVGTPTGAAYTNPGLGLDLSQIKLNEAQARNLNADADYKEGKNEGGAADIAAKLAEAGLKEAQKAYTRAQEEYTEALTVAQKFTNEVTENARQDILDEYKWRVKAMQSQYEKAMSESRNNNETLDLLKQKMGAEINEIMTQAVLNATKNKVAKEEIEKVMAETWSTWIQAENAEHQWEWFEKNLKARLEQTGMMQKAMIISAGIGAGGNVIKGIMDFFLPGKGIAGLLRKGKKGTFTTTNTAGEGGYYGLFE